VFCLFCELDNALCVVVEWVEGEWLVYFLDWIVLAV
jgi:hypothetical protein